MDAIILAGGKGTRLQSVVSDVPKPLAPVNGRPFLDLILGQLARLQRFTQVVLAVSYKAEQIRERYETSRAYGFSIGFSVESTPLGTGGAILQALQMTDSSDVLVLNGDSYIDFDFDALHRTHARHSADITLVVTQVEDTSRFGSVRLDDSGDRVLEFLEKSRSAGAGFINGGCYLIKRSALAGLPLGECSFERDVLPRLLPNMYAQKVSGRFIDIGVPESYRLADEYLR